MKGRGRSTAFLTASIAISVLALTVLMFKDRFWEDWNIHLLQNGSLESQTIAARRLGKIKSTRAARPLLDAINSHSMDFSWDFVSKSHPINWKKDVALKNLTGAIYQAFQNIGEPAMVELIHALRNGDRNLFVVAKKSLELAYPSLKSNISGVDGKSLEGALARLYWLQREEALQYLQIIQIDHRLRTEIREAAGETYKFLQQYDH